MKTFVVQSTNQFDVVICCENGTNLSARAESFYHTPDCSSNPVKLDHSEGVEQSVAKNRQSPEILIENSDTVTQEGTQATTCTNLSQEGSYNAIKRSKSVESSLPKPEEQISASFSIPLIPRTVLTSTSSFTFNSSLEARNLSTFEDQSCYLNFSNYKESSI